MLDDARESTAPALKKQRLLSIIEYAQQAARMRQNPAASVAQHGQLVLYEHQTQGLPGIRISGGDPEESDEIWISVERLRETKPPEPNNRWLAPWLVVSNSPGEEPTLRESVAGQALIDAGTHRTSRNSLLSKQDPTKIPIDPEIAVVLETYENKGEVHAGLSVYVETRWRRWAEEEKLRRRSIRLYSQLFTLQQQLDSGIIEATLELVCGVGMGIWNCQGTTVSYPLITRLVEISLNPITAAIEVRPRDVEPRLEIDLYASMDNQGVPALEKSSKDFFGRATQTFSPFDRGTFEPLLHAAVTHLDGNGVYWPSQVPAEDRLLPKADDFLKVTDSWILFARPRTASTFIADLERFKVAIDKADVLTNFPEAVTAVVTDPSTESVDAELPSYRGVSGSYISGPQGNATSKAQDLFFPKPFNDEQVRIIQLLEISDGVCVQGPPGTGKTHTIANVICHYLANGKRVLVTSMKEPALTEVQNKLPEEIRPLAISLLTSEADGSQMFRLAIEKIASEVQRIDRASLYREISHLDENIDAIHGRLARVDAEVGKWAEHNLARIGLDGEDIDAQDAAREVVDAIGQYEWFPDLLGVKGSCAPQITDADISKIRTARRILGPDIHYLGAALPQLADFPDARALLQTHQDLSRYTILAREIETGGVPGLADSTQETLGAARALLLSVAELKRHRDEVSNSKRAWTVTMRECLKSNRAPELIVVLETLGAEINEASSEQQSFLIRPVSVSAVLESDSEFISAVSNLAAGRLPFGLLGLVSKSDAKRKLETVRILGVLPKSDADWQHVERFVSLLGRWRRLAVRWNALAESLPLDPLAGC